MIFDLLFGDVLALVPIAMGLLLCGFILWCSYYAKKWSWTVSTRIICLRRSRNFIPILTLSGLFGTVFSLIRTLSFMADHEGDFSLVMPDIIARFAPALSSTFWGIIGAAIAIALVEFGLHRLGDENV